jgi:hypothetical protein
MTPLSLGASSLPLAGATLVLALGLTSLHEPSPTRADQQQLSCKMCLV